ncbi:MAG TPA: response regulator [Gemmatimonadaceae bacterium]
MAQYTVRKYYAGKLLRCSRCEASRPPDALASRTNELFTATRASVLKKTTRGSRAQKLQAAKADENGSRSNGLEEANKTASFVAHELNNLLTVIQINTEFLLESTSGNPESGHELDEIQHASKRASILARQLLASSRLEPFDPSVAEAALSKKRTRTPSGKSPAVGAHKPPRTAESILLVEDEAAVRTLAKRILVQKGYRVLEASDGAIALRVAAGHVGEIDLVLTDVAMPNLGGRGMVEELKELSPGMRVLFMSGYPKEEIFPDPETASNTPYLQKPFTSETLFSEVRAALGYQ